MTRDSPTSGRAGRASRVCGIRAASGGSLVNWIGKRGAAVLAIDIDTRFVEPLAGDTIEVRQLDIRTHELPERELDLVHARLVLDHQLPLPRLRLLQVVVRKPPGCRGDCRSAVA